MAERKVVRVLWMADLMVVTVVMMADYLAALDSRKVDLKVPEKELHLVEN